MIIDAQRVRFHKANVVEAIDASGILESIARSFARATAFMYMQISRHPATGQRRCVAPACRALLHTANGLWSATAAKEKEPKR